MENPAERSRGVGLVLVVAGITAIALFLNHPAEHATDFAGTLKEEAANQLINGIVHGGFVFVLAIELAGYAVFSARLGFGRALTIFGLAFFAIGAGMQMAQLTVDGLMIPQLAARYLAAPPDRLPQARSLFVLCGIAIQFLMPMALFFQAAGVACWGASLVAISRGAGLIALVLGLALVAMVAGAFVTGAQLLLMIAIVGLTLWTLMAGWLLFQRTV